MATSPTAAAAAKKDVSPNNSLSASPNEQRHHDPLERSRSGALAGSFRHQRVSGRYNIHLIAGNSNPDLAQAVSTQLRIPITASTVFTKPSGEVVVKLDSRELAGGDVYIIQPVCKNSAQELDINTALFELLFMIRRAKLAGVARITALVPFFAYARQDRKADLRCPLSASAVSKMIEQMGVNRVVTLDLHAGQIQGCFNGRAPMDNLFFFHDFAQYLKTRPTFNKDKTVIVSPDAGGVGRAHLLAETLGIHRIVTIVKRRAKANQIESMQTVGDVKGFDCVIIDDMVDTGGTLCVACGLLKQLGATGVVACIVHGIMTDPCCDRVNKCEDLDELVVSDSLPQGENQLRCSKLTVLPTAPLLARAIQNYHTEKSVSDLFDTPTSSPPTPAPASSSPMQSPQNSGMGGSKSTPVYNSPPSVVEKA